MLFSIITINSNDKIGLEQTIRSVKNQKGTNYEHIVIDGNSSDGSKKIIEDYVANFSYCISEPDLGIYNAMNKGIKVAKGDYILSLNSGDTFFENDVLERTSQGINNDFQIYYGDVNRIYNEQKSIKKNYPKTLSFSFFVDSALAHQTVFIKKTLFKELFYYKEDYKILADWDFLVYAICKQNIAYKHLGLVIANYDMNGISSQEEGKVIMKMERALTYKQYFPLFTKDYKHISDKQAPQKGSVQYEIDTINSNKWLKPFYNLAVHILYGIIKLKRKIFN